MKTSKLVLIAVLICWLQLLPVYGQISSITYQDAFNKINSIRNISTEETRLAELLETIERFIVAKNSRLLREAIMSYLVPVTTVNIKKIYDDIHKYSYNEDMIFRIYFLAASFFHRTNVKELQLAILRIYEKGDPKLFEIMVNIQLEFFTNEDHFFDSTEVGRSLNFAYILHKIHSDAHYRGLKASLQSRVNSAIQLLPQKFTFLFFEDHFCLLNHKYLHFIYPDAHNFWLWMYNSALGEKVFIRAEFQGGSTDGRTINVYLESTQLQRYYAIDSNKLWTIEFLSNDNVVIYQNSKQLCATETVIDDYREVRALIPPPGSNSECEWRLGPCHFSG